MAWLFKIPPPALRHGGLAALCLVAVALGALLGVSEMAASPPSTAQGRTGRALTRAEQSQALSAEDLAATRSTLRGPAAAAFELLVGLRGLEPGGAPDWERAQKVCEQAHFGRCDRRSLEQTSQEVRK